MKAGTAFAILMAVAMALPALARPGEQHKAGIRTGGPHEKRGRVPAPTLLSAASADEDGDEVKGAESVVRDESLWMSGIPATAGDAWIDLLEHLGASMDRVATRPECDALLASSDPGPIGLDFGEDLPSSANWSIGTNDFGAVEQASSVLNERMFMIPAPGGVAALAMAALAGARRRRRW